MHCHGFNVQTARRLLTRLRDLAAVLRANAIKMSLPGLTRQSICFEKALAK
jgi:hypothetical protein